MALSPDQRLQCLRLAKELRPLGHISAEQLVQDAKTFEDYVAGQAGPKRSLWAFARDLSSTGEEGGQWAR